MEVAEVLGDLREKLGLLEGKTLEKEAARTLTEEVGRRVDAFPPNDPMTKTQKAELLFIKGKAFSLQDSYDRRAEDALGKSVKLNPAQPEAWNVLGEVFYLKKDYVQSKRCFETSLQLCGPNKVSLRKLSMVSRFIGNPEERASNVLESVKLAKEAIRLDLSDGESWCNIYSDVLGNAHLTNFFVNEPSPTELNSALRSYTQAQGHLAIPNPDLHFNRATAYKFLESYTEALEDFKKAQELDPGLNASAEIEWIENFLILVSSKLSTQCGLKPKKIASLIRQLPLVLTGHPFAHSYTFRKLHELRGFANAGVILCAKITARLAKEGETPARFVALDASGVFFVLSFYSASPNAYAELVNFATVFVREPFLLKVNATIAGKTLEFLCVRVGDPSMVLVDNKGLEGSAGQSVLVNQPI
jgi:tetratricopeptide (TPR) repeat protein